MTDDSIGACLREITVSLDRVKAELTKIAADADIAMVKASLYTICKRAERAIQRLG